MYLVKSDRTFKEDDEGNLIPLANFTATIARETRTIDGLSSSTILTMVGTQDMGKDATGTPKKPRKLPEVNIDASEFSGFAWVLRAWGSSCVIYPGNGVKEDFRTAIQLTSQPEIKEVYGTMGWQVDGKGNNIYLHAGGAIRAKGNDSNITVELPIELKLFNIHTGQPGCDPHEAFRTSLDIVKLGPPDVMWPLWASVFAPIFGPVDFAVHAAGRSGTFKSEVCSLLQSHYGAGMDARHLPASWSSTANALEAQAFFACNALLVVDDFVPIGTSYQVKAYQTTADRLIRGQGNQAGRARLSDAASFKSAYYPRGIVLSTGEDTPEGHSVRARMLIVEFTPGEVDTKILTEIQGKRSQLPLVLEEYIKNACETTSPAITANGQVVTDEIGNRVREIRDELLAIGHSRTPPMLARLIVTAEAVLSWAAEQGFITPAESEALNVQAIEAIMSAGEKQKSYLETSDPVQMLLHAMKQSLTGLKSHVRSMSGGVPVRPEMLGWTATSQSGEQTKYKANGPTIGWIDWDDDAIYFEADQAFGAAKKEAGHDLTLTKQTAYKRLKDAGVLKRIDAARSRNTIRVIADGHTRNVIALIASDFFDEKEITDDDREERSED